MRVMPHLLAVDDLDCWNASPSRSSEHFAQAGADGGLRVGVAAAAPALALDVAAGAELAVAHERQSRALNPGQSDG